jgi:hypothetical protein
MAMEALLYFRFGVPFLETVGFGKVSLGNITTNLKKRLQMSESFS